MGARSSSTDAWVPYDERLAWFAEADLGVSAHRDSLEARLAFRTRLLDHIACGTPMVVTEGDVLADLVESRVMGRVVAAGDVDGWTEALARAARRRSRLRGGERGGRPPRRKNCPGHGSGSRSRS